MKKICFILAALCCAMMNAVNYSLTVPLTPP